MSSCNRIHPYIKHLLKTKNKSIMKQKILTTTTCLSLSIVTGFAQGVANANQALNQATSDLKSIFTTSINLVMVISGLVALIALVIALIKWHNGDSQTAMIAGKFISGGVFVLVGITLIKSLFGL